MENFNFGWAAMGLTIIFYSLPVVSFINYFSKKSKFDSIPASKIFTNYANSLIWYFYGRLIMSSEIRISNMIGGFISLVLIIIYLIYEFQTYLFDSFLNCTIVIIGTLSSFEWFNHLIFDSIIGGKICLIISFISVLAQLPEIYISIKLKNHLLIHINYTIIYFPTCICWIIFSLIINDIYVLFASLFGFIISIIQIIVYIYYKKEKSAIDYDFAGPNIGIDDEYRNETNSSKARPVEIA